MEEAAVAYRVIGGTSPSHSVVTKGNHCPQEEQMLPGAPSALGWCFQVQTPPAELGPSHRDSHVSPFSAESVSSICQVLEACSLLGGFEGIGCSWTPMLPSCVAALHDFAASIRFFPAALGKSL